MPTPPPRKPFQFHLSTAIVLMFVVGGLIWANVTPRTLVQPCPRVMTDESLVSKKDFVDIVFQIYGWPEEARRNFVEVRSSGPFLLPIYNSTSYSAAVTDAFFGLLILYAVWFLCEYLIRRRAAQKEA